MMMSLAAYAATDVHSKSRRYPEDVSVHRGEFHRDRDRIIHCSAFRRLEYKTQVFVNHEGDLFRTRLTHSLEVAQLGRTIARYLRLDEDLVEAIALAHDLGHTPFGHAGQHALDACMKPYGGFEHNLQSLRVVDELESRYGAFDGLNLTFATREGILKRCAPHHISLVGELGHRFTQGGQPSLEAQIVNLADEIAYNNHDVDDGLRSGILTLSAVQKVPLLAKYIDEVNLLYPHLVGRRLVYETVRRLINAQVTDVLEETRINLLNYKPLSIEDIRACSSPLVSFSQAMSGELSKLKKFLFKNLYRHPMVNREMFKAKEIVKDLFSAFMSEPNLLPLEHQHFAKADSLAKARVIANYIAGMTDRFAIAEHRQLYQ